MTSTHDRSHWQRYARAVQDERLPCALVDLDAFESNLARLTSAAGSKSLRLASKSVRCPDLLARAGAFSGRGVMTFTAAETALLAGRGARDLLLAYPTLRGADLELLAALHRDGTSAAAVADCDEHVAALAAAARRAGARLPVLIDVDVAYRPPGTSLHLGVRRSPLRSPADVVALAGRIAREEALEFRGLLAYEAQLAGLPDLAPEGARGPAAALAAAGESLGKSLLKSLSRRQVRAQRAGLVAALREAGLAPRVVNGGGTGSERWSSTDPALTEVTAGSGLYCSHLFSRFAGLSLTPALFFALEVVRRPAPGLVTCLGGGVVASGEAGADRLPVPALPAGLRLLPLEGAGEVQTPLRLPRGTELPLGAPVFFRPAKAGEAVEHFNELLLVRGDRVESRALTYRGLGHAFLG